MEARIEQLQKRLQGMIKYLLLKVDEKDYHGVADAAMDIREIETEIRTLEQWQHK